MSNPNKQSISVVRKKKKRAYRPDTSRHTKQILLRLTIDEYIELAQRADDMQISMVAVIRQGLRSLGLRISEPKQQWELQDISWEDLEDEANYH